MDLIISPEPHIEYSPESAVQILRREREERIQKLKRNRPDCDNGYQIKRQKANDTYDRLPQDRLPQGWLNCPVVGQEIGCMIPSKVPLSESFNDCIPPSERYSHKLVIRQQSFLKRKLGLVIDLTNSSRYYSPNDWKSEGVKYVKIACKGRDSIPENELVNKFVYEVSQFVAQQNQNKLYILVHCTHGHNRTGFMIVHYLMRTLAISVTQAIEIFADARPPGIYKPDYVEALYTFYHEKKPGMFVCPSTPEWKKSDSDIDDVNGNIKEESTHKKSELVLTNDDVLGDKIPFDQEAEFRQFCYQSLKLQCGGVKGGPKQFPGSHPVSVNRDNLQLLRQSQYYASWKADGTRYMMLITMDGCYLVDRHFNFRRVQMRFPCRQKKKVFHHFTLLDGEMVIDKVPGSHKQERRFLVYDMMAINQVSLIERPFCERWEMLEREVIEPRNTERQQIFQNPNHHSYSYDLEPFRVRRKEFCPLSTATKILKAFIPKLSHAADGLIFQRWDDPYVPRTHEGLLKWKYPEMNSVDFLFEMQMDKNGQSLYLHERGRKKLMEGNRVIFPDGIDSFACSGNIIECSWDSEKNVWMCMRMRPDKGTPNELNTYRKVMRSIKDNITEDILLKEINEITHLPMYADRT